MTLNKICSVLKLFFHVANKLHSRFFWRFDITYPYTFVFLLGNVHVYRNGRMHFAHHNRQERREQHRDVRRPFALFISDLWTVWCLTPDRRILFLFLHREVWLYLSRFYPSWFSSLFLLSASWWSHSLHTALAIARKFVLFCCCCFVQVSSSVGCAQVLFPPFQVSRTYTQKAYI